MNIINERPQDMSFEDYRALRKDQNKELKQKKRGMLIFVAKEKDVKKGRSMKRQAKGV